MESPVSLADLVVLTGGLMMFAGAVAFVMRLGGKLDRLSDAIEHLAASMDDHEGRLRRLEGHGE